MTYDKKAVKILKHFFEYLDSWWDWIEGPYFHINSYDFNLMAFSHFYRYAICNPMNTKIKEKGDNKRGDERRRKNNSKNNQNLNETNLIYGVR